jgi:hypothetical protein
MAGTTKPEVIRDPSDHPVPNEKGSPQHARKCREYTARLTGDGKEWKMCIPRSEGRILAPWLLLRPWKSKYDGPCLEETQCTGACKRKKKSTQDPKLTNFEGMTSRPNNVYGAWVFHQRWNSTSWDLSQTLFFFAAIHLRIRHHWLEYLVGDLRALLTPEVCSP